MIVAFEIKVVVYNFVITAQIHFIGCDVSKQNSKLIRVDITKNINGTVIKPLKLKKVQKVPPNFTKWVFFYSFSVKYFV